MRLLVYLWNDYLNYDLREICTRKGIDFTCLQWQFQNRDYDEAFFTWFDREIDSKTYDALISINYFPVLAEICKKKHLKYIAWCYDNPLNVRNIENTLAYETNYVFVFDRVQWSKYVSQGFSTVYHMPLGVNAGRVSRIRATAADYKCYGAEAAFVGNLYESKLLELLQPLEDYTKGYLKALMDAQQKLYGCYLFDEFITDEYVGGINQQYQDKAPGTEFQVSKEALSFAMASEVTRRERIILLNLMGKRYQTKFYSYDKSGLVRNVEYAGSLDYVTQMPLAFQCAKINLNPTLRIIQTGIPLRAFDIMGSGGFLLSNWQEELAEYYVDGQDMVLYESVEDAVEKAGFYIRNDAAREKIIASGRRKTLEEHSLERIIEEMLKIAGCR